MRELSLPFSKCFLLIAVLSCFFIACRWEKGKGYRTWEVYRGDEGSNAYSQLTQINIGNVKRFKVAWIYSTGDKSDYFSPQVVMPCRLPTKLMESSMWSLLQVEGDDNVQKQEITI